MRIGKLYLLIGAGLPLVLGSVACQSAHRSAAVVPGRQANAPALAATSAPTPQPSPAQSAPTALEPKSDPVAELIAQVEKEYQAGQENYKAGHLEAAKQNFDQAFNLLLESSLDIR